MMDVELLKWLLPPVYVALLLWGYCLAGIGGTFSALVGELIMLQYIRWRLK